MEQDALMSDPYARYDYAWKTPGWTVQDPSFPPPAADGYLDPGLPADVSLVRVYGSWMEWNTGRGLEGVVRFRVNDVLTHVPSGQEVMPGETRLRFRKGGFSIYLPATDDPQLTPNGFEYECRLTVRGITRHFTFTLPAGTPEVNITSLIPAE